MGFFRNPFGKKEENSALTEGANTSPMGDPRNDPNLIRVFDKFGRELFITKDQWRSSVLPGSIKSNWDNPDTNASLETSKPSSAAERMPPWFPTRPPNDPDNPPCKPTLFRSKYHGHYNRNTARNDQLCFARLRLFFWWRLWPVASPSVAKVFWNFGVLSAVDGLIGALLHSRANSPSLSIVFGVLLICAGASGLSGLAERMRFGWTSLLCMSCCDNFVKIAGKRSQIQARFWAMSP